MDNLTLAIIIPAYNEEKYIGKCIESILIAKKLGYINEIIVIDNNSTDETCNIVRQYDDIKLIHEKQKGPTFARQKGYIESSCDLLAFVDADCQMPLNWAEKVIRQFEKNKNIGFISGPYSYYDGNIFDKIGGYIYWNILMYPFYWIIGYAGVGGNMIFRKSVLDQMGGFDTSIEFYGDDTNAARRANQISKTIFLRNIQMPTSYRRFNGLGKIKTAYIYTKTFFNEVIFRKQHEDKYEDYR